MRVTLRVLSLLSLLVLGTTVYSLQTEIDRMRGRHRLIEELSYFPSGRFLRQAVLGYEHLAADLIWLRAIQYFGQHRLTDLKFEHLGHILDILTTLDPQFIHAYTFGALLLTDYAKGPEEALELLKKGMRENPNAWEIPFTAGFIHYIFLRQLSTAAQYFLRAGKLPDAPEACLRFAGFVYRKAGQREVALRLWIELYNSTENKVEKETALRYVNKLTMERHAELVEGAVETFRDTYHTYPARLEDLVTTGLLEEIPRDPHGGHYFLDPSTYKLRSTARAGR